MGNVQSISRSALRSRAETSAQDYADRNGEPAVVYLVFGGYEARPASAPEPRGANRKLATLYPRAVPENGSHADDPAPKPRAKGRRAKGAR
jgi:hypothetical protein